MASWSHEPKGTRRDTAKAVGFLLALVIAYVIACTVEGHSLNPSTDCGWNQMRMSDGTCR